MKFWNPRSIESIRRTAKLAHKRWGNKLTRIVMSDSMHREFLAWAKRKGSSQKYVAGLRVIAMDDRFVPLTTVQMI